MVIIKSFGNDVECKSAKELACFLKRKYINQSVSIFFKLPSGINQSTLVDVQPDGSLLGTYNRKKIEFSFFNF